MNSLDLGIISLIIFFAFSGLLFGFISTLGSILGVFLGVIAASVYYEGLAVWLVFLGTNSSLLVSYLAIFLIINRMVGLLFFLINVIFKIASIIPFVKSFNQLLGGALGFIEGILIGGIALFIAVRLPLGELADLSLRQSLLVPFMVKVGGFFKFFLPEKILDAPSIFSYVF